MSLKKVVRNFIAKYQEKFCLNNYKKILTRVQNKKGKIRVLFLVRENQKWSYQSLYELLEKDEKFEPLVVVSILEITRKGKDKTRQNIDETYRFFRSRGMETEFAYKKGKYVDLREFNPDIIFYDQPWDLPKIHQPQEVSKFALTCYTPYGISLLNLKSDYTQDFHRLLFRYYIDCKANKERFESYRKNNSHNCVIIGYPKLDNYFISTSTKVWKDENKIKVIYAPHYSFDKNGLNLATFKENGNLILELAKNNPQTTWVFRPHPRFKHRVLRNNIMNKSEVENYYNEWRKIGVIFEEGDYLGLFQSSDLMITDCSSFLMEYLPTNKPLLHLINQNGVNSNKLGNEVEKLLYQARTNEELITQFQKLIHNKDDEKRMEREDFINKTFSFKDSNKIYTNINYIIGEQHD